MVPSIVKISIFYSLKTMKNDSPQGGRSGRSGRSGQRKKPAPKSGL